MGKKKCKHVGYRLLDRTGARPACANDYVTTQCIACDAIGVRGLGRSNDDSDAVRVEIQAAETIAVGAYIDESNVWRNDDTGTITVTSDDSAFERYNATLWPWDPTRPVAGQGPGEYEFQASGPSKSADITATIAAQNPTREPDTAPPDRLAACAGCEVPFGCRDGQCLLGKESERQPLDCPVASNECAIRRRCTNKCGRLDVTRASAIDHPLTVSIDSDGVPAVQLNGLDTAPPMFTSDEAEALADDLLLGADAARQAAKDGYHGPAKVVRLCVGDEPEEGEEFEIISDHVPGCAEGPYRFGVCAYCDTDEVFPCSAGLHPESAP